MSKNFTMTGTVYWEKLRGEPQPSYDEAKNEWSIDITPDARGGDLLKRIGLAGKLRNKDDDRGDFITFRRPELKKDGTANGHVEIVDEAGEPWPEDVLIGNGSQVKVKFGVLDLPAKGKFKAFIKPILYKVTVTKLVEFKPKVKAATAAAPGEAPAKKAAASKPAAKDGWQDQGDAE